MLIKLLSLGALLALAKANDGNFLGSLDTHLHGVNGELYSEDDQTLSIKSFVFDGENDDAYFVLSKTEKIEEPLEYLSDELGFKEAIGTYMNEDISLRLRPSTKLSDFKSFGVYCKRCQQAFGSVVFGKNPKPMVRSLQPLSKFEGKVLHGISGEVLAVDEATLLIKNFNYDGASDDGQFVLFKDVDRINETMELLADEDGTESPMVLYRDYDVILSLKPGTKISQYRGLAIYCAKYNIVFGVAAFPQRIPKLLKVGRRNVRALTYGQFVNGTSHNVTGFVHRINERTLLITRFTYDGMSPDGQFVFSNHASAIVTPDVVADERGNKGPLRKYERKDVFVNLPEGKTVADYQAFAVYCAKYNLNFGHVFFPSEPRPALPLLSAKVSLADAKFLGQLVGLMHNVSGEIYAIDEMTLLLKNFTYDGTSPDGRFVLSKSESISKDATMQYLLDEWDSEDGALEYNNKNVLLKLKEGKISDYKSFGVFCKDFNLNFGSVVFDGKTDLASLAKAREQALAAGYAGAW